MAAKSKNKLAKLTAGASTNYCSSAVPDKPSAADKARERRYQAEDALRTLTRAGEIQRNGTLMRDVKSLAKEQMGTLKKVVGSSRRK